jgi:hypothetical protein
LPENYYSSRIRYKLRQVAGGKKAHLVGGAVLEREVAQLAERRERVAVVQHRRRHLRAQRAQRGRARAWVGTGWGGGGRGPGGFGLGLGGGGKVRPGVGGGGGAVLLQGDEVSP